MVCDVERVARSAGPVVAGGVEPTTSPPAPRCTRPPPSVAENSALRAGPPHLREAVRLLNGGAGDDDRRGRARPAASRARRGPRAEQAGQPYPSPA
ncbi:hypothetical protein HBB16_14190 [Pseudonocardia sp. MCCB 268]|nr:hypothetical protein [Pseudonocardia cytotoxica]